MPKYKDILLQIADVISKKAKSKYKSNVEFANVCNVNESTIRRVLQGKQNVSLKILKVICEHLDIKLSDLFKETGN